ncbi:P-loop containing nucleoside triphosphate hydrolase protein [Butyriboletus roseoflavus]|nr:P-loop containing nucleoside triphosphate hydrolase protein [Butyriboletus roseoflavus]
MEHTRRRSDNSTKGLSVIFPGDSTRRSSTDRLHGITRLQPQPTIFGMDFEPDNPASTKGGKPDLEATKVRNVVIFGDSGVGKSSLINMLAGRKTAETSNGAIGCTFQSCQYTITINGEKVNIWDTAGLDEGTRGRVPPEIAEKNLSKLLRELRSANGIHLLVYCIRGPSVRKSLARNYTIFYSAICRKKVPIVAVVTGLENEPTSMEAWWAKGEKELAKYKMRFEAHACVTTIDMQKVAGSVFEKRSIESQQSVQKLIMDNCHRAATRPPSDTNALIKAALIDFRSMMKSGWENVQPVSTVVFYQTDIPLFQSGVWGDLRRVNSQINGRSFVFQHAGDLSSSYITPRISKGGADLLIFAGTMTNPNVERFRSFYDSCNGDLCPFLVITDDHSVDAWAGRLDALGVGALVASIPSSPMDGQTQTDLSGLIDELCLVRAPAKYRKGSILRIFRRKKEQAGDEIPGNHD